MKELVLFYSYSGNTKKIAEKFAQENNFDIFEVADKKKPNKFVAYTAGIVKVMRNGVFAVIPPAVKFEEYDIINIFAPVWADHPAPSMNAALKMLPKGAKIKLFMVSHSGKSGEESVSKRIGDLGLEIIGYENIKNV